MPSNKDTAQHAMDAFYQQYKTNADFWTVEDFDYWVGISFAKIIEDQYRQMRAEMKADKEEGYVTFAREWSTEVVLKVQQDKNGKPYVEVPLTMTFPFDPWASGIQEIYPVGNSGCGQFIRTSGDSDWMLCYLPTTDLTFWYLKAKNRIEFRNVEGCNPKEIVVLYIPSADSEEYQIPDTLEFDVIGLTLNLMMAAKEKRVIKKQNDLNPNAVMEAESDLKRPE